jgi:hypothetical protein
MYSSKMLGQRQEKVKSKFDEVFLDAFHQLYPHSFPIFFLTEATAAFTAHASRLTAYLLALED